MRRLRYRNSSKQKGVVSQVLKGVVDLQVRSLALRRVRDAVRPEAALRLLEHHLDRVAPHADDLRRVRVRVRVRARVSVRVSVRVRVSRLPTQLG